MAKKKTLFLAVYKRSPGYVSGSIQIGLIEAETKEEARGIVKEDEWIKKWGNNPDITIAAIGEMVEVMSIPTKYRDY